MGELFTPRKANRVIGRIEELLTKVIQLSSTASQVNGAERAKLIETSNQLLDEIQSLGCEVKSLELGLIDFPAIRKGQSVYLCWKLGDRRISHWHTYESGYSGRRPIEEGDFEEPPVKLQVGRDCVELLEKVVEKISEEDVGKLPAKIRGASQLDVPEIILIDQESRALLRMLTKFLDVCEESEVQQVHKLRRLILEAVA